MASNIEDSELKDSLSIECSNCGHDNKFLSMIQVAKMTDMHPEHIKRLKSYGKLVATFIERGNYVKLDDEVSFKKQRTPTANLSE